MTNQQAPEIYALHTVPNEGKKPWFGIYAVRADAEHDAKVMRDATGRDWSVVRLVVADTAATPTGPITRYEVVDCIDSKHVPAVIPNGAGPWVRYEDHVAAMVEAQQPAPSAAAMNFDPHAELRKTWQPGQRWQTRTMRHGVWGDWSDTISGRPLWFTHQQYRRHPDEIATQPSHTPQADSQPAPVLDYPQLPRVGPIGYASVVDIDSYVTRLTIGPHLVGVRDVALWTTDQMRAYADETYALRIGAKHA